MDTSVILDLGNNKIAVKRSNFEQIDYNNNGSVFRFVKNSKIYTYCVRSDAFFGFLEAENFAKQMQRYNKKGKVTESEWRILEFKSFSTLLPAENGDLLEGAYSVYNQSGVCKDLYRYPYSGTIPASFKEEIYKVPNSTFDCNDFGGVGTPAGKFFDKYKNESFWDTNQADINLIGEISSLLKEAGEKAATAFIDFTLSNSVTSDFLFYDNNGNGYARQQFLEYKRGLKRWLAILKEYSSQIGKLTYGEKLFLAVNYMYRHNMLTMVSIPDRINILKILVEKKSLTWAWVNADYGFIHAEDLALYVLKSVTTQPDAIVFLDKLVSTNVIRYEVKDHQGTTIDTVYTTLYKLLFYRMDDYFGQDNFTDFTKELERIVKLKHNVPDPTPEYTIQQLQQLTTAQFFWRENGPKLGRIKYEIVTTDTKVKIKETICTQTELKPIYTSHGVAGSSVTVITGYEEVCVDSEDINFTLNHFDLIAIYFYSNPSFIDLYEDEAYEGKLFITFAGFFDYIHEKEQTKIWENVFNNALFVVSLAVGIGELAAAVRTVNFARAFLGLAMITSDTALYIATGTPFHNYIITTYGQQRGSDIISNLTILSTIASLGTNALAGSGILKAYSREEGLKLVGTGEAILKDSNATIHMTLMEINALEDAIKRIKNEFYAIRNEQDAVETIINTKANVFFNKFSDLENGINTLTQVQKLSFYNSFVNISERELEVLRSVWLGLIDTARIEVIENSNTWLRYIKARDYLKNGQHIETAKLFNKSIRNSYSSNGLNFVAPIDNNVALSVLNISQDTNDFVTIGNKLNIEIEIMQDAKNHYFIKEHFVRSELSNDFIVGRFSKDEFDINEWISFRDIPISSINQNEIDSFRKLIVHEYIESKLMNEGVNFRAFETPNNYKPYDFGAHDLAPTLSNGAYPNIGRLTSFNPPLINFNNFTKADLDNVVNWYKNFYKL